MLDFLLFMIAFSVMVETYYSPSQFKKRKSVRNKGHKTFFSDKKIPGLKAAGIL